MGKYFEQVITAFFCLISGSSVMPGCFLLVNLLLEPPDVLSKFLYRSKTDLMEELEKTIFAIMAYWRRCAAPNDFPGLSFAKIKVLRRSRRCLTI